MNLFNHLPPFPASIALAELAEATGQPVAHLRAECQRLDGDGTLSLYADGAELRVRREPTAELLTTAECARRLGISRRRVQALIAANRLSGQKIGRDWLVPEYRLGDVAERKPGRPLLTPARPPRPRGRR